MGTCHRRQEDEAWSGFYVEDNGPGIAPEDQPHLFERFYRGRTGRQSGASGTGLGLSIAQEIVGQHQGWISVESEGVAGKGSKLTVWVPAHRCEDDAQGPSMRNEEASRCND